MAEWPKAPDSKSGLPKGNVGSTPTLSSPQKLNKIRVSDGKLCLTALVAGVLKDPPRVLLNIRVSDGGLCPTALVAGDLKDPPRVLLNIRVSDGGLCPTALVAGDLKDPPRVLLENGEMPEWPKGHDWKSCVPQGTVGSTPTLSSTIMGTLKGFPCPPALWLRRAKPAYANAIIAKFLSPNPPALWLQRAKPAYANAVISKFPISNPPALWLQRAKPAYANAVIAKFPIPNQRGKERRCNRTFHRAFPS